MIISLRVNLMKIRNLTLLKILIKYLQVKTVYIQSKISNIQVNDNKIYVSTNQKSNKYDIIPSTKS